MSGKIVNCTHLDSVRIEVLGEGRAIMIPASLILAADKVLRHCLTEESSLDLDPVEDDETRWTGWEAQAESLLAEDADTILCVHGETPWQTIMALAQAIEREQAILERRQ